MDFENHSIFFNTVEEYDLFKDQLIFLTNLINDKQKFENLSSQQQFILIKKKHIISDYINILEESININL